jgi:Zn-dependent protease with chaperone function
MADFSPSATPPSDDQAILQAGLAALKRKDYRTAVAQLELCQTSTDTAVQLKAQMGLVKAYVRTGRVAAALNLCQPLCQHPNPQVQTWAQQTLSDLRQHPALQSSDDPTGFTAFAPAVADDQTGFVPLEDSTPQNRVSAARPSARPLDRPSPDVDSGLHQQPSEPAAVPFQPQPEVETPFPAAERFSESVTALTHRWRNAGRSMKWTTLGQVDVSSLWALEVGSLVLLFWLIRTLLQSLFGFWNGFSIRLSWMTGIPRFLLPTDLTVFVVGLLASFLLVSPWLLDWLLRKHYGLQNFSLTQLEAASPEASRLLKRLSSQRRQPVLKLANRSVPFCFSYGNLPVTARIVVSQGLLDQLQEDEIACLVAAELAHIRYWDFGVLSLITLLAQLPYRLYWQLSTWADRQHDRVLRTIAVAIASLNYGLFWLVRLAGLWLSRVRLYYSDRQVAEWTGNPNGLSRALLKVMLGTAEAMQQQHQTSDLLESFTMLLPVGYRQALTTGSYYNGDANLLEWERQNPYRRWLVVNNTHPPLGDRLNLLTRYARQWRLESELDWRPLTQQPMLRRQRLLLQGAPFFGIPIGFAVAIALWALGWLARQVRLFELAWLVNNGSVVLACCLLGFSIGLFLRINPSFPDIRASNLLAEPDLRQLMSNPEALPIDSQPVELTGTLLGRKGLRNWLYRDLWLQTTSGAIRLHYTSGWGWLGDLLPRSLRPTQWIDQTVRVRGWFRRGATPWIDVDTLQVRSSSRLLQANHPVWSTILASAAALWAIYILFVGG